MFHCIYVPQILYSFTVDGYLGCFHVLAIVNSAANEHWGPRVFSILVSSVYMPNGGISASYGCFIPNFLRNLHTDFHGGCIILHSQQQCKRVPFSAQPLQDLGFFDDGHFDWCEVISHCTFYLVLMYF